MAKPVLKEVNMGWKALGNKINQLIDRVTAIEPLEGDGIRIVETSNGKLISVSASAQAAGQAGDYSVAGSGKTGTGGPTDGDWMTVTIVDPSTCVQSQIQVWAKPV